MDAEQAGIGEAPVEGIDRVAEAALLAHLLEQARGHAAAEQRWRGSARRGNLRRMRAGPRSRAGSAPPSACAVRARRRRHNARPRHRRAVVEGSAAKRSSAKRHQAARGRRRRRRTAPSRGRDSGGRDSRQMVRAGAAHRLGACRGWCGRAAGREGALDEEIEHAVLGRIERGADLLDDDAAARAPAPADRRRSCYRMSERMSTARSASGLQDARVIGGGLDAGGGVDLAADRLDLLGDVGRRAARGALEGHVLEQDARCRARRRSSSRDPAPTQTPSAALSRWSIAWLTTVSPDGSLDTSTPISGSPDLCTSWCCPSSTARARASTKRATASLSLGRVAKRSSRCMRSPSQSGRAGRCRSRPRPRPGTWRDGRVASVTIGAADAFGPRGDGERHGGMRIGEIAGIGEHASASSPPSSPHRCGRRRIVADGCQRRLGQGEGARLAEPRHQAVAPQRRRARSPPRAAARSSRRPGCPSTGDCGRHDAGQSRSARSASVALQDVVRIGGDHQPLDRQTDALGDITGEDVAEIARRHA